VRAPPLKKGEHHAETGVDDDDQPPPDWTKTKADWEWEQVCHSICHCREQKPTTFMLELAIDALPRALKMTRTRLSLSLNIPPLGMFSGRRLNWKLLATHRPCGGDQSAWR
jgi:hypothetical protein